MPPTEKKKGSRTCRHFRALSRKNLIIWRRSLVCSIFELVLPCALISIIVWLRTKVEIKHTDLTSLEKYKHPIFPALHYLEDEGWTFDQFWIDDTIQSFMNYLGYAPRIPFKPGQDDWSSSLECRNEQKDCHSPKQDPIEVNKEKDYNRIDSNQESSIEQQAALDNYYSFKLPALNADGDIEDPKEYKLLSDWMGPFYFMPDQCIRQTSWSTPKRTSPIIGMIDHQNAVQEDIYKYYKVLTKQIISYATIAIVPNWKLHTYASKEELYDYLTSPDYMVTRQSNGVCFAFEVIENAPNDYEMRLHMPDHRFPSANFANAVPNQQQPVYDPTRMAPNMNAFEWYSRRGYGYAHNMLANQVLKQATGNADAQIHIMTAPVPGAVDVQDNFQGVLSSLLPLCLLIAYIPMVYNMVFRIVKEKESFAKETMLIMGMTDLPYWLSWFVFYTCINTVVTTLAWFFLLFNVINYSNPLYLWLFFWLYGEAVFGQIIFLQSMFTSSKYAGIVSTILYFCGVLLNKVILGDNVTRAQKVIASLLPQVALLQGSVSFANYEGTGVGLDWSTAAVMYQDYSFNTALWMLFIDFLVFSFLGLYLDKVIPSDFGQRLGPCFLCTPSYYRCCRPARGRRQTQVNTDGEEAFIQGGDDGFEISQMPADNYEPPPVICQRLEAAGEYLRIENLQKTFGGGFRAVKGVNMKMYDSQIFVLLGHNGAGKSTVISMLTGLIEKSQGNASCYDVDLFDQMDEVREFMGVCPQHDVLFDLLTPREHLDIFYDFKGGDPARKQQEIDSLIQDVGLSIDQRKLAHQLSGGNKRKLSVCVSLCGGSRLVMLDEPTSGMDLGARRNLWDMLKSYKKDKIIILTTHYMDEADVLGDRIGIMCKGTLQCIGSSLFLKNRFGVGYKITFVKKRKRSHPGLEKFLQSYFNGVAKATEVLDEISYVIPKTQAQNFGGFFEALDAKLDEFDIRSYGVSMSNLEDVFLKINQEFAPDLFGDLKANNYDDSKDLGKKSSDSPSNENFHKSIGHSTMMSGELSNSSGSGSDSDSDNKDSTDQFEDDAANLIRGSSCARSCTASSAKRFIIYKRDWCGLLCQIVIPLTLVLFGLWLTSGPSKLVQSPSRQLSTGWYPYKQRIIMNDKPYNQTLIPANQVTGRELAAALPNATEAFEVTFIDDLNYTEFYNKVYEARNDLPLYPYRYGSYQIYHADKSKNLYQIVSFLNVTSQDVTAMYPQYMYQAILRVATNDPEFEFSVTTEPYPIYQKFKDLETAAGAYDFVFMTAIALALVPCVMVQFILNERELQLKHQQLLSGMSLAGYWVSNLIFDIVMAYIPILLIIMLTFVFDKHYQGIWVLFLLFPPAIVPFTYVTSFLFRSDINAQIMTLFLHFVSGGLLVIIVFVLQYIPVTMKWGDALRIVFCIFPSYCVTHGILFSASGKLLVDSRSVDETEDGVIIPRKIPAEIWDWYNLKLDAFALGLHFFVGIAILALIELEVWSLFSWCASIGFRPEGGQRGGPQLIQDDDVIAEEKRVALQDTSGQARPSFDLANSRDSTVKDPRHLDCIRVHNFEKVYQGGCGLPVRAVRKASFALDYGECFALLGVNGAGKSTTFKSLTREIMPTTGKITIQGYDVGSQFQDARKLIGYCPQYDAIFPKLTVEETIKFYALVKGIKTSKIKGVVEKAIKTLNLKDHRHKFAGTLSGGNKRKLSVAMALIGNPPIILLDEPSAGMDPEARRFMWQVVEKISQRDKKSAVILTTHSMEEAEALATKMGIMVRGGIFRCMGSAQHIKNKFGIGYEIEIKVQKAPYNQLEEMARELGFKQDLQTRVNFREAVDQCVGAQFDEIIIDQLRPDGLGADLVTEAELDDQDQVKLRNLVEFLYSQNYGFNIIRFLSDNFKQVEVLEQCGEFFKLRVPKEGKTIGWLFGQLEQQKRNLGIQEYSVSQTTLEQIFQSFANQSIASDKAAFTFIKQGEHLQLVNPDHKMTEEQERLSQRGLSFVAERDHPMMAPPALGLPLDDGPANITQKDADEENVKSSLLLPKNDWWDKGVTI